MKKSLGVVVLLALSTGQVFANQFPQNRVISKAIKNLDVSVHDLKLGCSPYIAGETVGLISQSVEQFLKSNLSLNYDHLAHPNFPTPMIYLSNDRHSCTKANDQLRTILLATNSDTVNVDVVITRSERFMTGFGDTSSRSYDETFQIKVGNIAFGNSLSVMLEEK